MKTKVYCDTMIWYHLAEGTIELDKENYEYIGTVTNIADFLSSDKMNGTNEEKARLKAAIIAMDEFSDEIIFQDPISVASRNLFKLNSDPNEIIEIKKVYKELLRYAKVEVTEIFGPGIDAIKIMKQKFREGTLNAVGQFIDIFKNKKRSKSQKHELVESNVKKFFFEEWSKLREISIEPNEVNWHSIRVLIGAYTEFIKSASSKDKPNKNTVIDLLQLCYLDGSDKKLIWTLETKLLAKIKISNPKSLWKDILYQENKGL